VFENARPAAADGFAALEGRKSRSIGENSSLLMQGFCTRRVAHKETEG